SAPVTVRMAGMADMTSRMRILVASSLAMRNALYNPFAQRGEGPVRFTAVASEARAVWRLWPALVRGRFDADMDVAHGILSGRCGQVELLGVRGYALDGELFDADPARPLMLTAGRTLRVLRPAA